MTLSNVFWGVSVLIVLLETALLIWLWVQHGRLRRSFDQLRCAFERQQRDIVGLCAAAVRIDERMGKWFDHLKEMDTKIHEMGHLPHDTETSYQTAIERIAQGAGVDDLVDECGLTREEAVLLIRMHRNDD